MAGDPYRRQRGDKCTHVRRLGVQGTGQLGNLAGERLEHRRVNPGGDLCRDVVEFGPVRVEREIAVWRPARSAADEDLVVQAGQDRRPSRLTVSEWLSLQGAQPEGGLARGDG